MRPTTQVRLSTAAALTLPAPSAALYFRPGPLTARTRDFASPGGFRIPGRISRAETIAQGTDIRELPRPGRVHGPGNRRKRKGTARIQLDNGDIRLAELHWYEAHGIGRREVRRKRYLD